MSKEHHAIAIKAIEKLAESAEDADVREALEEMLPGFKELLTAHMLLSRLLLFKIGDDLIMDHMQYSEYGRDFYDYIAATLNRFGRNELPEGYTRERNEEIALKLKYKDGGI